MDWERWALVVLVFGLVVSWILHIRQSLPDMVRLWIYSLLMMVTFFFYGIHRTSTFDLAAVMIAIMMIFTMTGEKSLVTLCQITFFLTFIYDIFGVVIANRSYDRLTISRTFLHIMLVLVSGWIGRKIIDRWRKLLIWSDEEVEALRRGTERLNDFLTNISHEIRTPVNAVMGLTGVCLEKEKDPEIRLSLKSVEDAGRRVGEQISDILDYSEIETNKLAVSNEDYMLSSLLNDIIVSIEPMRLKDLELVIDVDASLPTVMNTDVSKLKRIIWHLIVNGLKYTRDGGVFVRLSGEKRDYGINLQIEVTDTGIGMSEEEVEQVFNDFYQADSGRTRSTSGLGLGLVIVNGFVKSLKGFISIESSPGNGTTVRISIPQKVVDERECMRIKNPERLSLGAWLHIERYDNPQVREFYNSMVKDLVKGLKIEVHRAENAEGFKKLIKGMRFTNILLGQQEYEEEQHFMEDIAREIGVVVVADSDFTLPEDSAVKIIRKPFYCFPMVNILNMDVDKNEEEEGRFTCPGIKALVVDDEPMNLSVALSIFKRYGMTVFTAESGREALDLCIANNYDIVFMDHMMPGMDGVEAMKLISAILAKESRTITMVALTANAVSTAKEMFLNEGFDGFVRKPVDITELERVLKRVIPKSFVRYEKKQETFAAPEVKENKKLKDPDYFFNELKKLGIDTEKGLRYCQYDRDFYRTLLKQYGSDAAAKIKNADKFREDKDFDNYAIIVHSIKSTSKMIGALSLSGAARVLEDAAKNRMGEPIEASHEKTMKEYEELSKGILFLADSPISSAGDGGDDEIMEFFPEESEDNVLKGGEA